MATIKINQITFTPDGFISAVEIRSELLPPVIIEVISKVASFAVVPDDVSRKINAFARDVSATLQTTPL